ncbi:MAG: hypothetical protein PUE84_09620, partial [Firmicutes bacterium]|nr:hypothetical protein [Bacillota bacterium]
WGSAAADLLLCFPKRADCFQKENFLAFLENFYFYAFFFAAFLIFVCVSIHDLVFSGFFGCSSRHFSACFSFWFSILTEMFSKRKLFALFGKPISAAGSVLVFFSCAYDFSCSKIA